ncbi:MAG: hypothetical protein M1836_006888 [Candelina mexicana]|nr:MAG: hypothetical protein M1836_006888 [Candelina mexicana]
MEALSLVSNAITFVGFAVSVSKLTRKAYYDRVQATKRVESSLLGRNYGSLVAFIVTVCWPETATQYEQIDAKVLHGGEEETLAFRQAIINESNMTAIAGAIIAQVAITALSLPFLSSTHWTARACFLLAVVSGCLSVYYACALQRIVGKLYRVDLIKEWLKMPPLERFGGGGGGASEDDAQRTSLAAVLVISAPFNMVRVSVFAFLLGLAIYQGFVFTKGLDTSAAPGSSRANFIAIMVGTGLCSVFFTLTFSAKHVESILMGDLPWGIRPNGLPDAQSHFQTSNIEDNTITETKKNTGTIQDNQSTHAQQTRVEDHSNRLAMALEAATRAHVQCAKADRQVALAYAKLSEVV